MEVTQEIVKIDTNGKEFLLTPSIVKQYICPKATNQEVYYFLQLCKAQNLNPFIREVYLIKYNDSDPATMVTGKETFLKRAMRNPKYQGHKAWTEGSILENNLKAYADVFVAGYQIPITVEVDYEEYVGTKAEYVNGKPTGKKIPNKMWSEKPKTMLRKVALMQALREAFPDELGGLYDQTEINTIPEALPETEIKIVDTNTGEIANVIVDKVAKRNEEIKEQNKVVENINKKAEETKAFEKEEVIEAEVVEQQIPNSVESVMEQFGATEAEEVADEFVNETMVVEEKKTEPIVDLATEAQIKMIYSTATRKNISEEIIKEIMKEDYGKESSKELSKKEASKLIEYLLTGVKK